MLLFSNTERSYPRKLLNQLWEERPQAAPEPTKAGVMLLRLEAGRSHTPDLFAEPADKRA